MRLAWLLLLGGCATLGEPTGGDAGAPHANAGPFRLLRADELGNDRVAPYVLKDAASRARDLTVVDVDDDPATLEVFAVGAQVMPGGASSSMGHTTALVRFGALDGRTFDREPTLVFSEPTGWEGDRLEGPDVIRTEQRYRLYYGGAGGIGLAESGDGHVFTRVGSAPVLGIATVGWDAGAVPSRPSVVRLPTGEWRMFFEADGAIGEAESSDGVTWTRHPAPALEADSVSDERSIHAPGAVRSMSALGRPLLWLYHAVEYADGRRGIHVAAREGDADAFARATSPVLPLDADLQPSDPMVIRFSAFSLLFATARAGATDSLAYPAVLAGVAPATVALPPPNPR